jgi:cytochrome c-type biogenesis protein CcmH
MSVGFWFIAAAFVLLAVAFLAWPLLRSAQVAGAARKVRDLNLSIYRERAAELEEEHAAGVLSESEHEEARRELEQNLLADVEQPEDSPLLRGRSGRTGLVIAAVLVPALAVLVHVRLYQPDPATLAANNGQGAHNSAEIAAMAERLAERLKSHPDDAEGWVMLARTYTFMERPRLAADAYREAHRLLGDKPDILTSYAESLILAGNGVFTERVGELTARALAVAPRNTNALWLAGIGAYQNGEHEQAAEHWQLLLDILPPGSESARTVRAALGDLPEAARESARAATATAPQPAPAGPVLEVDVSLGAELAGRLRGDETLLVYARAAEGSPMPLAVVRQPAREMPVRVRLDGSQGMVDGMTMDQFEQVQVVARLSRGTDAAARSGDMQGTSAPLDPRNGGTVSLTIDQLIP